MTYLLYVVGLVALWTNKTFDHVISYLQLKHILFYVFYMAKYALGWSGIDQME